MNTLFARALVAFLVCPGVVAFLVPYLLVGPDERTRFPNSWGALPFGVGLVLLLACVREFYVAGRGTLAPWSPPKTLVVTGLYRWSRKSDVRRSSSDLVGLDDRLRVLAAGDLRRRSPRCLSSPCPPPRGTLVSSDIRGRLDALFGGRTTMAVSSRAASRRDAIAASDLRATRRRQFEERSGSGVDPAWGWGSPRGWTRGRFRCVLPRVVEPEDAAIASLWLDPSARFSTDRIARLDARRTRTFTAPQSPAASWHPRSAPVVRHA